MFYVIKQEYFSFIRGAAVSTHSKHRLFSRALKERNRQTRRYLLQVKPRVKYHVVRF